MKRATVQLSFTVKEEDLQSLQNWVSANKVPLFIVQVFYDCAFALPFSTLEEVIALPATNTRHVPSKEDPFTKKDTYKVPLTEGVCLGDLPEPDVEGKVFKAPNGKVTVYGRLTGSVIEPRDASVLEKVADGTLSAGQNDAAAGAARPPADGPEDEAAEQSPEDA